MAIKSVYREKADPDEFITGTFVVFRCVIYPGIIIQALAASSTFTLPEKLPTSPKHTTRRQRGEKPERAHVRRQQTSPSCGPRRLGIRPWWDTKRKAEGQKVPPLHGLEGRGKRTSREELNHLTTTG